MSVAKNLQKKINISPRTKKKDVTMNAIVILGSFINAYKISPVSGKNMYTPYCSAYNGGGPSKSYYYNPLLMHYPYNYAPSAVYGNVVPVRGKPKNKPRNKDKI